MGRSGYKGGQVGVVRWNVQWYFSPLLNIICFTILSISNPLIISTIWSVDHRIVIVFLWFSVFLQSTTIGICIHVHNAYTCNMSTVTLSLESFDEIAPPSLV